MTAPGRERERGGKRERPDSVAEAYSSTAVDWEVSDSIPTLGVAGLSPRVLDIIGEKVPCELSCRLMPHAQVGS